MCTGSGSVQGRGSARRSDLRQEVQCKGSRPESGPPAAVGIGAFAETVFAGCAFRHDSACGDQGTAAAGGSSPVGKTV